MKPKWARWLMGAGAAAGVAAVLARWPPINDVETGKTPEYPDIQPRHYPLDPDRVFLAAQEVGYATPGWKLGDIDPRTRSYHGESSVALTPFVDDVWVRVEPEPGGSVVHVRSKSRVGKGDLGVNARRIRHFFEMLDAHLAARIPSAALSTGD